MNERKIIKVYEVEKSPYGPRATIIRHQIYTAVWECINKYCPLDDARILDIGCGKGLYTEFLRSLGVNGMYLGVDIYPQEEWNSFMEMNSPPRTMFALLDATKLTTTFSEIKFNFIFSITSLEHIEDDGAVLQSFNSIASKNSYQVMFVPSKSYWLFEFGGHGYHHYSHADLRNLAISNGLEIVELYSLGGIFSSMYYLLWAWYPNIVKIPLYLVVGIFSRDKLNQEFRNKTDRILRSFERTKVWKAFYPYLFKFLQRLDSVLPFGGSTHVLVTKVT